MNHFVANLSFAVFVLVLVAIVILAWACVVMSGVSDD